MSKPWSDEWMWMRPSRSHNRRIVTDTNEPGRVITTESLEGLQLLAQITL